MTNETKNGLQEAQDKAREARATVRETNRNAVRNYLRAAFSLQRAGLEALDALQHAAEELAFNTLDRVEQAQDRYESEAAERLQARAEQLREARARVQRRIREEAGDVEEAGDRTESRVRESAEIGLKVLKVLETRIETMLTELVDMGRRELNEIEDRIDELVERLDTELEEEIHPIPGYDELNVEEVTAALPRLDEMQLRTVRAYEVNHSNRVTVLRAIDEQLAERDEVTNDAIANTIARGERAVSRAKQAVSRIVNPIPNYDSLNVQEVEDALTGLDSTELAAVRGYEMANKDRVTVLRAIDARLEELAREKTRG